MSYTKESSRKRRLSQESKHQISLQKPTDNKDTKYKMANRDLYSNTGQLVGLSFFSMIVIGISLFLYAIFNDYVYYNLNQAVLQLQSSGLIGTWVNTLMENYQDTILILIPNTLDLLWVATFILFAWGFLQSAYYTKREGYLSALGFLTFGIMIVLFIMGVFTTLSTWFQTEFIAKLMPTLVYATPFFSLYLDNVGLVNALLICVAVILNFVDLDLTNFKLRKQQDMQNEGNEIS